MNGVATPSCYTAHRNDIIGGVRRKIWAFPLHAGEDRGIKLLKGSKLFCSASNSVHCRRTVSYGGKRSRQRHVTIGCADWRGNP